MVVFSTLHLRKFFVQIFCKYKTKIIMKKTLFIILVSFLTSVCSFGENDSVAEGRVKDGRLNRATDTIVSARLVNETIEISFSEEFDNIMIIIENSNGVVVFSDIINATSDFVNSIDVSNFETGEYLIKIGSISDFISGYFYKE